MKPRKSWLIVFVSFYVFTNGLIFWNHQTRLGWTFVIILITWGLMDLIAKVSTGKTMSQHWVPWAQAHPRMAWTIGVLMLATIGALVMHLNS